MTTSRRQKRSVTVAYLERLAGAPLTFGRLLSAIRQGDGHTQVEFAKMLGISKAHLCDVEKDRRSVSVVRASKWAKTLGYGPEQFIELSLQGELVKNGLPYSVKISPLKSAG
jgi:transcriptional regulator with XRE-family HTH domain